MKKFLLAMLTSTSMFAAPQAVVFDFGGVLATPSREVIVNFFCQSIQLQPEEFEKANLQKRSAMKLGRSEIDFWREFAKKKGIQLSDDWAEAYNTVLKDSLGVDQDMYAVIEELKAKNVPVALLSNIDERYAKMVKNLGLYQPFNPCLLSFEIGVEKPNDKAYQILLERLPYPADSIVFIDDLEANVEAAKKAGIDAILFKSSQQIRNELCRRGLCTQK